MGYSTEELDLLDLAPGEPFSQDSQNRSYRYSQSLACPGVPYNSAESEYLEAQFGHFPSTSEFSPVEETEDQQFYRDVPLISPNSTSSQRYSVHSIAFEGLADSQLEGYRCNENSPEDISALADLSSDDKDTTSSMIFQSPLNQPSDSLGQSVLEVVYGQKTIHGCSKTHVHCDSGLLEEETQIEDACVTIPATINSELCSENLLKHTARGDEAKNFVKSGMAVQQIHAASKSPDSCAAQEPEKVSSIHTYKQEPLAATETTNELDIVQRWHCRKRRPLSANTRVTSDYNTRTPGELRGQAADKFDRPGRLEAANPQQESEKENQDPSKENQSPSTCIETTMQPEPTPSNGSPSAHPEAFHARRLTEGCGESNSSLRTPQKRLRDKDLKSFWQVQDDVRLEWECTLEQGNVKEGGWLCPRSNRKYRVRVKQRSIDMWIR